MKAIGKSLSASVSAFGSLTNAADAVKALTAAQTALRGAADRIAAITPPDAIKSQHAQLIKGVRDFADELGPIVAKLKKGDMTALSTPGTLKGLAEIQASATAISNKGYKIGG